MSSNIASINAMFSAVSNMRRSSGYTPPDKEPEEVVDEIAAIILVITLICCLFFLLWIFTVDTKKDETFTQIKGVGYYATNYSGKYNRFIFLGDTSEISKDSAVQLMKNRNGKWFLEIKEYYETVKIEKAEEINKNEVVLDCLGDKFMDYKCENPK
jgi:hypothetical protein